MPRVFIPPAMRAITNGEAIVDIDGANVGQVIDNLEQRFPGIKDRFCKDNSLRPGLSVAVGSSISSYGLLQKTPADAEVHFLPAIGGG